MTPPRALTRREGLRLRALVRSGEARRAEGAYVAEGKKIVRDALAGEAPIRLVLADRTRQGRDPEIAALLEEAHRRDVPVALAPAALFARIPESRTPQGILALLEPPRRPPLEEILRQERAAVVIGDGLQDPANAGSLARLALAFGCDALVLTEGSADPFGPKAVRAACGALLELPVFERPRREIISLGSAGLRLLAAHPRARVPLDALPPPGPRWALLLGGEGGGLSPELAAGADVAFRIPISPSVESLNVSAAAAIILHRLAGGEAARAPKGSPPPSCSP